jgi:hypothetical protein
MDRSRNECFTLANFLASTDLIPRIDERFTDDASVLLERYDNTPRNG